jgi:hypothetical protein
MKREMAMRQLRKWCSLVAQLAPSTPGMTAWVGVYPLDPAKASTEHALRKFDKEDWLGLSPIYRIRFFEVEEKLIEADVWIGEEHLHMKSDLITLGDESLFEHLSRLGVGPDDLGLPETTDYPI